MTFFSYVKLIRPVQWLKNLMLFFPPFLSGIILHQGTVEKGIVPFIAFCAVSSSGYIINDVLDSQHDAFHPVKKHRPIPSKVVNKHVALILGVSLACIAFALGFLCSKGFVLFLLAYLVVVALYSYRFKDVPIVDIFCIAIGFLIRLQAGGNIFAVEISDWLFLTVFLLAMFLSTGKRLGERTLLGSGAGAHRKSLLAYPDGFLDGAMYMTGAAVLVTYTMYVISRHSLIYSVPLCLFGLLRYMYLVKNGKSGDPTESLCKDRVLFTVGILWAVMVGWSLYGR